MVAAAAHTPGPVDFTRDDDLRLAALRAEVAARTEAAHIPVPGGSPDVGRQRLGQQEAELAALEAKYQRFVQASLEQMRCDAASDLNRGTPSKGPHGAGPGAWLAGLTKRLRSAAMSPRPGPERELLLDREASPPTPAAAPFSRVPSPGPSAHATPRASNAPVAVHLSPAAPPAVSRRTAQSALHTPIYVPPAAIATPAANAVRRKAALAGVLVGAGLMLLLHAVAGPHAAVYGAAVDKVQAALQGEHVQAERRAHEWAAARAAVRRLPLLPVMHLVAAVGAVVAGLAVAPLAVWPAPQLRGWRHLGTLLSTLALLSLLCILVHPLAAIMVIFSPTAPHGAVATVLSEAVGPALLNGAVALAALRAATPDAPQAAIERRDAVV